MRAILGDIAEELKSQDCAIKRRSPRGPRQTWWPQCPRVHTHARRHTQARTSTHTPTHAHAHKRTRAHTCRRAHTHTHTHTDTHTHTHTHTNPLARTHSHTHGNLQTLHSDGVPIAVASTTGPPVWIMPAANPRSRRRRKRLDLLVVPPRRLPKAPCSRRSWLSGASPAQRSLARIGRSNRIGHEMDARHRRGPISEGAWAASARRTTPPPLVEAPAGDV